MKKILYCIVIAITMVSCSPSATTDKKETKAPEKDWVYVEFMNPTDDSLIAIFLDTTGLALRDTVPPHTSVMDSVLEGNYTFVSIQKDGKNLYIPHETPELLADTFNFKYRVDEKNDSLFGIKMRPLRYDKVHTETRYLFDLSVDSTNRYALTDIKFRYGGKGTALAAFKKETNNGKNFIYSIYKGHLPMIIPYYTVKALNDIPESISTYYGVKFSLMYIYPIPKEVGPKNKDIFSYLMKTEVLPLDE
jgi:hypothetical protein